MASPIDYTQEELDLIDLVLEPNGYYFLCKRDDMICGVMQMCYTHALMVDLDEWGYDHRYCYHTAREAETALALWDGIGDPGGDYIKRKG